MSLHRLRPGFSAADLLRALSAAPGKSVGAVASRQGAISPDRAGERDPGVLRRDLAVLAAQVDLDSESAIRALRRPVVRRILLWEFGESFLEHPEFQSALDAIESTMDADPAARAQFQVLLKSLRVERAT